MNKTEKYGSLNFQVISLDNNWVYEIYTEGCRPYDDGTIESQEFYDTEQEARFAAIGHIDLLENGENR